MDEWDDDGYAAIYDEQDRERVSHSPDSSSNAGCCAVLLVFALIALVVALFL